MHVLTGGVCPGAGLAHVRCTCGHQHILGWDVLGCLVFSMQKPCAPQTENLDRDSGAGCHSSNVCSTYCKLFLRVSRKAGRCTAVPGGVLLTPSLSTSLQKGLEGQSRATPGFSSALQAAFSSLGCLAWGHWLPLPELWGCFALTQSGRHQWDREERCTVPNGAICPVPPRQLSQRRDSFSPLQ